MMTTCLIGVTAAVPAPAAPFAGALKLEPDPLHAISTAVAQRPAAASAGCLEPLIFQNASSTAESLPKGALLLLPHACFHALVPRTIHEVIVHHSYRLHKCVADRRTDEAKAAPAQIRAQSPR